jgi:hypothetical protein
MPRERQTVADTDGPLQRGPQTNKMVNVPLNEENKSATIRKYSVCWANGRRKETSVTFSSCSATLWRRLCFDEYHTEKN